MFPPAFAVSAVVATVVSTAGLLVFERVGLATSSSRLAAVGLVVATSVTIAGLVVARSRWAQRHAVLLVVAATALAIWSRPIDLWWAASLGVGSLATVALLLGPVTRWLATVDRRVPIPRQSVVLMLLLLDVPLAAGLLHPDGTSAVVVAAALASWLLLWAYSQAWVPALWALRFVIPFLAVGWSWNAAWWGWAVAGTAGLTALWAAWSEGSLLAVQPLEPRKVAARPILAELAPEDVRRVARIDERGRRQ